MPVFKPVPAALAERFSVGAGDAAVFWTTTPGLANVISRVTGTAPSHINGMLALQAAPGTSPNLYFIKPNGVLFGASSRIDMPAEFHVSTVHHVRFKDGEVFRADGTQSRFTVDPPEAFGFIGGNGAIRFDSVVAEGRIQPPYHARRMNATAGAVDVTDSRLRLVGGALRLMGVGDQVVEIPMDALPATHPGGAVTLSNSVVRASSAHYDSMFNTREGF